MTAKMIIIDDEAIIRESLRQFIDWESIDVEICDIASSGMTAMASILSQKPDIILTDIRMPGLDGLELIRLLREQNITSEVIFISAHTNFEYARQAISLGAFGYVIKPIDEEELLNTVKRCKDKIDSGQKTRMALSTYENAQEYRQQQLFTKLLSCHEELIEEEQKLLDAAPIMQEAYTHVMAIGLWYPSEQATHISRDLLEELFQKNSGFPYLFLAPFAEAQFVFLLTGQKSPAAMYHYAHSCIQKDFFKQEGLIVTLSEAHTWEGNFSRPFTDCELIYSLHIPRYASGIFLYSDTFTKYAPDGGKERFLKTYFSSPMEEKQILPMLKDFLQYFIADQSVYDLEFMKLQFIRLVDTWVESLRSYHLHDYLEQDALSAQKSFSAKKYLYQIFEAAYHLFVNITDSLEHAAQVPSKQLIRNSLAYIRENFGQNITLVDLARNLYVSPAYLSKVFSTEIGQPFSKYLQEYRVNKAIEYLRDSQYKVYQIASICGFSDVAYFSKIFKSLTGMTPNQYRNTQVR